MSWLALIPRQVWIGLGIAAAALYAQKWAENRGYVRCQGEVQARSQKAADAVRERIEAALREAERRATEAEARAKAREEEVNNVIRDAATVKVGTCVPPAVVERLQRIQNNVGR